MYNQQHSILASKYISIYIWPILIFPVHLSAVSVLPTGREQFYYFDDPSTRRSNLLLVLAVIHSI